MDTNMNFNHAPSAQNNDDLWDCLSGPNKHAAVVDTSDPWGEPAASSYDNDGW